MYFRHIVFDEVPGKILEALLAIREGYTRCPAHQWMRVEKLVSMLSFSARDLKPQIKFFKKTFRNSVRRVICGCNRRRFSCCNKRIFSCHNKTSCREVFRKNRISRGSSGQSANWKMISHRTSNFYMFIKKCYLNWFFQVTFHLFMKNMFFIWSHLRLVFKEFRGAP